jgi:hypothetical protein
VLPFGSETHPLLGPLKEKPQSLVRALGNPIARIFLVRRYTRLFRRPPFQGHTFSAADPAARHLLNSRPSPQTGKSTPHFQAFFNGHPTTHNRIPGRSSLAITPEATRSQASGRRKTARASWLNRFAPISLNCFLQDTVRTKTESLRDGKYCIIPCCEQQEKGTVYCYLLPNPIISLSTS